MSLPTVVLFATGGTIASLLPEDPARGYAPALRGEEVLRRIPGHRDVARIELVDLSLVRGGNMTPQVAADLCRQVNAALRRPEVTGAVISHGTTTLEDTCFLADLLVRGDKPVIGTGAMYHASWPEWDGRRNLLNSLRAATSPESRQKGVMVCMNGELHAARDVTKDHASSPAAFVSPGSGPLGCVDGGEVIYYRSPACRYTFPTEDIVGPVDVIKVVQGADDRLVRASVASGARGLVLEGLPGYGALPSDLLPAIRETHDRGVPVVISTRSPLGRVSLTASAAMVELGEAGVIPAGDLPSHKARLLLMVALAHARGEDEIRAAFRTVAP
ncbi:MAG: asparaginase [Armatimonadetes bacterium]|nr:asparaginase [Armatimonadota bacterium]